MRPIVLTIGGQRIYPGTASGQRHEALSPVTNWRYLKQRAETADLFTFDLSNPCLSDATRILPEGRAEVAVYKSEADYGTDTRWFGGVITSVKENARFTGSGYNALYSVEAQSYLVLLAKELRQPQLANLTWEALLKTLMARHFSGVLSADVSQIVNPVAAPPVKIVNGSLLNLLHAMRTLTGYEYEVDAYKRLCVFKATDRPASFILTDSPESGMTAFSEHPQVARESRNVYNIVRQPFRELVAEDAWPGEVFIATGDPKSGQLPLLRRPETNENAVRLEDKFDGLDADRWVETDVNTTQHPDYPNQGYLFAALGQLQIVGGTGALGGVALQSQDFFEAAPNSYIVQEFQLTDALGTGYIACFTDGAGLTTGNLKAGLKIADGALQALDGTVLLAALGTTANYLIWVTQTATGWQYDIQGGAIATRQTVRTESAAHLSDYKLLPVASVSLKGSINAFRYRKNERGIALLVNDSVKTVGMESSDTDLPDIDAFLNLDESPAVIKFKAGSALALVASVTSATVFNVVIGEGTDFLPGARILAGVDIIGAFDGKAGIVASVVGDQITLVSPGITGLAPGNQVIVGTTLPAKGDKIQVLYSYFRDNEAVATDPASIARYGGIPLTLAQKDHVRDFAAAQLEADANLERFRDGILNLSFDSNSLLIPEPDTLSTLLVSLSKRPEPINRALTIQEVVISPAGRTEYGYAVTAESADPVRPLEDRIDVRNLVIGQDGVLRFTVSLTDKAVLAPDLTVRDVTAEGLYITLGNPHHRKLGEFRLKP